MRNEVVRRDVFAATRLTRLFALSVILFSSFGRAQEVTATITGTITDPSGASVAGAKVTAKDLDRGTDWPTTTNGDGFYKLPRLPIGRYEVRVEQQGFQKSVQSPVELQLNQAARLDFEL